MSDTYKLESEIRLKVNTKRTYDSGTYSIVFAGAAKEGEYDDRDLFANAIFFYPEEDYEMDDREFYKPEVMVGRPFEYKFELTGGIGKPEDEEEEEEEEEKKKRKKKKNQVVKVVILLVQHAINILRIMIIINVKSANLIIISKKIQTTVIMKLVSIIISMKKQKYFLHVM